MALRGPTVRRRSRPKYTSLSPPRPQVCTSIASIMVRQPPITAPSALTIGRPSSTMATSVVVPPMSATRKLSSPCRKPAPTTLAAGPESTVSTGYSSATSAFMSVPSPLTIITGAVIPSRSSTRRTAASRCAIWGVRRAFSAAVRARLGASSLELSS